MFTVFDFVLFGLSLGFFTLIGLYYGFKGLIWPKKQKGKTNRDFLTGASDHRIISAGFSIFAAFISPLAVSVSYVLINFVNLAADDWNADRDLC